MSPPRNELYGFGPFTLDASRKVLSRDGGLVALPPKAVDLLIVLVQSAGEVVLKEELMRRVWPDTFVEEGNLAVNVFTLRKALGDAGEEVIRTIPKRGYCFVAEVRSEGPKVQEFESPRVREPAASGQPRRSFRVAFVALLTVVIVASTLSYVATTRTGTVTLPGQVQTLAVLPFSPAGLDATDEYIAPGFASAVAASLSRLKLVLVRPMTSTVKYGAAVQDPIEAGRALQVSAVLHGSVRRAGDAVQVAATLLRVEDGKPLWHSSTTVSLDALPALERSIATAVASALGPLSGDERETLSGARTTNPQAYRAFLKARWASHHMTPHDVEIALAEFTRARDADPRFADAYAGLASFLTLPINAQPTIAKYEQGAAAATRALLLDPQLTDPHTVLARAAVVLRWDWEIADRELKLAIAAAPYDAEPRFWYALQLSALGRHDVALSEMRFAQQIDPTSPRVNLYLGILLTMARRYDEALAQLRKTPLEMGVTNQQVYFATAAAEIKKDRLDDALATLNRTAPARAAPSVPWQAHRAYIDVLAGRRTDAGARLAELDAAADVFRPSHTVIAGAWACLGNMERAFARLERAYDERDSRLIFLNVDPLLDCARPDPRFSALVRRMGLEPGR